MDDATALEEMTRCLHQIPEQTFRAMPEGDLVRCLDAMAHTGGGPHHELADYRNELTRRETIRQNQRLEALTETLVVLTQRLHRLTRWVAILTVVVAVLTGGLFVLEVLRVAGIVR
jgi:hypothetical protein